MANRILLRRDTAENWTNANPVLANGEIGLETDTQMFKIGDGIHLWSERKYYADAETIASQYATTLQNRVIEAAASRDAAAASAATAQGARDSAEAWRNEAIDAATDAEGWANTAQTTANGVVTAFDDSLVSGIIAEPASDTRLALDALYANTNGGVETATVIMWPALPSPRASADYWDFMEGNTVHRIGTGTDTWDRNFSTPTTPDWVAVDDEPTSGSRGSIRLDPGSYIITGSMRLMFEHNTAWFTPGDLYGFGFSVSEIPSSLNFSAYWSGDMEFHEARDLSAISGGAIQTVLAMTRHVTSTDYPATFGQILMPDYADISQYDEVTIRFDITKLA